MLAKEINFTKGLKFKAHVISQYGKEYDETKSFKVIGVRNYKRGQKVQLKDMNLGYQMSLWKEEYPH